MKRTAIWLSALVLVTSLALVSCDAMFETNMFAKATHPTPSAADITAKTPQDLQKMTQSAESLKQLKADPDLKDAALANLATFYQTGTTINPTVTVEAQVAAVTAADIAIKTVPDAAGLSGSIISMVAGGTQISTDSLSGTTDIVKQIMPEDIQASLADADPLAPGDAPSALVDMITAFSQANAAYEALGLGIAPATAGGTPAYAAGTGISASATSDIAVNALIAGLISAVAPMDNSDPLNPVPIANPTPTDVANALWIALVDPSSVGTTTAPATNPPITIDLKTFSDLTGTPYTDPVTNVTTTPPPSPVYNLLLASGLGSLFTSSTTTTGGI